MSQVTISQSLVANVNATRGIFQNEWDNIFKHSIKHSSKSVIFSIIGGVLWAIISLGIASINYFYPSTTQPIASLVSLGGVSVMGVGASIKIVWDGFKKISHFNDVIEDLKADGQTRIDLFQCTPGQIATDDILIQSSKNFANYLNAIIKAFRDNKDNLDNLEKALLNCITTYP